MTTTDSRKFSGTEFTEDWFRAIIAHATDLLVKDDSRLEGIQFKLIDYDFIGQGLVLDVQGPVGACEKLPRAPGAFRAFIRRAAEENAPRNVLEQLRTDRHWPFLSYYRSPDPEEIGELKASVPPPPRPPEVETRVDTATDELTATAGAGTSTCEGCEEEDEDRFRRIAAEIGELVTRKNKAYGNSFNETGDILRILYPTGIAPDQYDDALAVVRILDKLKRIATDRDALGESPFRDIAGYGILGTERIERLRGK